MGTGHGRCDRQLRERVNMSSNNCSMIGKGRNKWKVKGGGVGILVRNDRLDVDIK